MSVSKLAKLAKVDRGTLSALESDDPTVTPRVHGAIMTALERLEYERGIEPCPAGDDMGTVTFTVKGNFGVEAVVEGPVRDLDALQDSVTKSIAYLRSDAVSPQPGQP